MPGIRRQRRGRASGGRPSQRAFQVSPEQFPETDCDEGASRATGNQRFAYRFSGADFGLRIQADQILPELAVSEVLAYRLGENELAIDAEIELDIREAPLRELLMRVPKGYAIARLNASGLSDYFLREPADQAEAELRLVYGQPLSGRQVVQLRLERKQGPGRSRLGAAADRSRQSQVRARQCRPSGPTPVFGSPPERTQGLTEIATAFFPRKVTGIQAAFRVSDTRVAGRAAGRAAAADGAGRRIAPLFHRRRHRLRQQCDELRRFGRAGLVVQG